ncbi:hypothetical protein C8R45DRAFT_602516 [Mycena sanguinolenta]|nr:hypothetical protein C8R45DRAFT_602516 [Mycena sanguinolenta]
MPLGTPPLVTRFSDSHAAAFFHCTARHEQPAPRTVCPGRTKSTFVYITPRLHKAFYQFVSPPVAHNPTPFLSHSTPSSRRPTLARAEKHTGERAFTCHCSKQFSRLDNLRQHAQTVHADKAAMNEARMRELTSLHASMTGGAPDTSSGTTTSSAASATGAKSKKGSDGGSPDSEDAPARAPTETKAATKRPGAKRARASASVVKREASPSPTFSPTTGMIGPQRQRPGTSTGYEGAVSVSGRDVNGRDEEMDVDGEVRFLSLPASCRLVLTISLVARAAKRHRQGRAVAP